MENIFRRSYYDKNTQPNSLVEDLGTIQIGQPDLKKFVSTILSDIRNKRYLNKNLLSDNKISLRYTELTHNNLLSGNKYYIIEYKNVSVSWIENIDIVVVFNDNKKTYLENCEAYSGITEYSDKKIKNGCILIYNPDFKFDIEGGLYHEFRHYFIELNRFVNTCLQLTDEECYNNIFSDNKHFISHKLNNNTLDFSSYYGENYKLFIDSLKEKSSYFIVNEIDRIFATAGYYLNNDELSCNLEEIFSAYKKYYKKINSGRLSFDNDSFIESSIVMKIYYIISKMIKDIDILFKNDKEINEIFNKRYGSVYYDIFHSQNDLENELLTLNSINYMTIHQICQKYFYKLKRFSKHFKGMSEYCKNGFVDLNN